MQVGGGVSQNPQLRPKIRVARRAEQNPTSVSHAADTSSRKGRRGAPVYNPPMLASATPPSTAMVSPTT